jgi:hypothetical protein
MVREGAETSLQRLQPILNRRFLKRYLRWRRKAIPPGSRATTPPPPDCATSKFATLFAYFAAGADDKSANISTPVRCTSPRNITGRTPSPPPHTRIFRFQKDRRVAGKWFSGDDAKISPLHGRFRATVKTWTCLLRHCLRHSPAGVDAVAQIIEFARSH